MSDRREPLTLASEEDLEGYAMVTGSDPELVSLARKCPVCKEAILACDNGWLDAKPAEDQASPLAMVVMKMGTLYMMAGGDPDGGSRHTIHDHQPDPEQDLV